MSNSNNNVSLFTKSTNTQGANLGGVKSPGHKKMQNLADLLKILALL